jgi:ElaB/YqjD/DUF883 family membrane-anchored ribosome-binding protein
MPYEPTNSPGTNRVNDPSTLGDDARRATSEASAATAELARKASRKADQARATAAEGLDTAAGAVHTGAARVASAARSAADALTSSAQYVREHDARDMMDDLMQVVKNNPGPALLGAVALGFVLGRALSRD